MLKLHLGCGGIHKEEYINIDIVNENNAADRIFDLSKPLDYEKDSVELIEGYHVLEHLPFNGIQQVLESWYRVLVPTGKLILELPDFDEVIKRLIDNPNDNSALASVFGNQDREGQYHHWGWNKTRLKMALEAEGFKNVIFLPATDYHKDLEPCFRVEAEK